MRCPHCKIFFHDVRVETCLSADAECQEWMLIRNDCPRCNKMILLLEQRYGRSTRRVYIIYPPSVLQRDPLSPHVPDPYANDYNESARILQDSPKASAAISRRSLQMLLRDKLSIKKGTLYDEIQQAMKHLPGYLSAGLDKVRIIGNLASHPIKNEHTGEVIDVEPGEADWLLDILVSLYNFFFVDPAVMKEREEELEKKLSKKEEPEEEVPEPGPEGRGPTGAGRS